MAFTFRKIISNMYFKKPNEEDKSPSKLYNNTVANNSALVTKDVGIEAYDYESLEPDSTSKQLSVNHYLPQSVKTFGENKCSLSDTDLTTNIETTKQQKCKTRTKLNLDIKKATQSKIVLNTFKEMDELNLENTPKHVLLQCKSSEIFSERIKAFNFKKSFDLFDHLSDEELSSHNENIDIESLSLSESDFSLSSLTDKEIKMCRKVEDTDLDEINIQSATPESFADVEIGRIESDGTSTLLNYQIQLEKIEFILQKLFSDFQFHVEVSKVFNSDNGNANVNNAISQMSKNMMQQVFYIDNVSRGVSPTGSWNLILDRENQNLKIKVKQQLLSLKGMIEQFIYLYQAADKQNKIKVEKTKATKKRSQKLRIKKKKIRYYDFPDLEDAFNNLFSCDEDYNKTTIIEVDSLESRQCVCKCHCSQSDSGVSNKVDQSISNQSISSSIGNFTLDSTTLSAFSESLDLVVSYNSFDDSSLYNTLLRKPAIERITFYIQVHSIEITSQTPEQDFESKNIILFHCPSCKVTENEENGVLKHILSQSHCEKIHFLYKTAYIKKCVADGVEIQPSTVLNSMTLYRDVNKIVCFGDAKYACSLCFENLIVGESVLINHCSEIEHIDRRERLHEILE